MNSSSRIELDCLSNYHKLDRLGKGTYSVVFKVKHNTTGIEYAAKKFTYDSIDDGITSTTLRELAALKCCNHPNILKIISIFKTKSYYYAILPCYHRDLKSYWNLLQMPVGSDKLLITIKSITYQMLQGLHHIHSRGFIHRDLKPQNILINWDETRLDHQVVICDFGLVRRFTCHNDMNSYKTPEIITLWYRPPEIILGDKKYGNVVDMWSIGCIVAELLLKKPLFPGDSEFDQLMKIFQCMGTPDINSELGQFTDYKITFPKWKNSFNEKITNHDPNVIDLMKKMLHMEPSCRISCKEALEHPFFQQQQNNSTTDNLDNLQINDLKKCYQNPIVNVNDGYINWLNNSNHTDYTQIVNTTQIDKLMRFILYDWLIEVQEEYYLLKETYFRAIGIIDRYMSQSTNIQRKKYQLLGITALLLAAKIEEVTHPSISDMIYICDNTFTESEIVEMEYDILTLLEFNLYFPIITDFLPIKCKGTPLDDDDEQIDLAQDDDDVYDKAEDADNVYTKKTKLISETDHEEENYIIDIIFCIYYCSFDLDFFGKYHPKYIMNSALNIVNNYTDNTPLEAVVTLRMQEILNVYPKDPKSILYKYCALISMYERSLKKMKCTKLLYDSNGVFKYHRSV
jgi:serine/threonine protein kinase